MKRKLSAMIDKCLECACQQKSDLAMAAPEEIVENHFHPLFFIRGRRVYIVQMHGRCIDANQRNVEDRGKFFCDRRGIVKRNWTGNNAAVDRFQRLCMKSDQTHFILEGTKIKRIDNVEWIYGHHRIRVNERNLFPFGCVAVLKRMCRINHFLGRFLGNLHGVVHDAGDGWDANSR